MACCKTWSRNKKLSLSWIVLALAFFASGVILVVVAFIFHSQASQMDHHPLKSLVIGTMNLTTATVLGIFILACFLVGVWAFLDGLGPGHRNKDIGLVIFSWLLIASLCLTLVIGSIVWFFTLRERADYAKVWQEQSGEVQALLQTSLSCCGYWNATSAGLMTQSGGLCDLGSGNSTTMPPCVTSMTAYADVFLNNVFTTASSTSAPSLMALFADMRPLPQIYGFTAIQVCLFLVSVCLIISRREQERFRRVDEKKGVSGGFV